MVSRALISSGVPSRTTRAKIGATCVMLGLFALTSRARAQLDLTLPDCAPTHVDVGLLRELLTIELEGEAVSVVIGSSLCDASATQIDIEVRGLDDVVALPTGDDPRETARAAALAIAERVPHLTPSRSESPSDSSSPPETPPETPPPSPAPSPTLNPASDLGVPVPPAPPGFPATFGVGLRGRILPVLPSWALGLRFDLDAHFDPTWSIRGELFSTWTRATANEGDIDAVVAAGAAMIGASVYRDTLLDLVVGARAEGGVLVAMGWSAASSTAPATLHPWITAGGEVDLTLWLDPSVALALDLGVSAVIYGTRLMSWPSGTQIDYSILAIDLGAGLRFPL